MTDPRSRPDDRPNVGTDPLDVDIAEVQGDVLPADQDAVVEDDQIEEPREATLSEQEWGTTPMPDRELLAETRGAIVVRGPERGHDALDRDQRRDRRLGGPVFVGRHDVTRGEDPDPSPRRMRDVHLDRQRERAVHVRADGP
jgi:hypothetical protein